MVEIVLRKRFGAQWFRVNALVQPNDWMVEQVAAQLRGRSVHAVWDWVIEHIAYPWGQLGWSDIHSMEAFWRPGLFGRRPRFRYAQRDYWSMPGEVLRDRMGDCKDSAALLTSLLRHQLGPRQVYMSVGQYRDAHACYLHAWTTIFLQDGTPLALDTTYPRPIRSDLWITESPHYHPFWRANDHHTVLLDPAAARQAYGADLQMHKASARFSRAL